MVTGVQSFKDKFALTSFVKLQEYSAPTAGKPQNKHELKEQHLIAEHFFL